MEVSAKKARLPHIPIEIIRHILFMKSSVKTLIRFQCVCKEWRSIIQDQDFKLSYLGRKPIEPQVVVLSQESGRRSFDVTSITNSLYVKELFQFWEYLTFLHPWGFGFWSGVWCSCNGLVLFSVHIYILLWNPSTGHCTRVLELGRLHSLKYNVVSGLCYDSSTGDYKAVILLHHRRKPHLKFLMVASLRNKEWREVQFPYNVDYSARNGIDFRSTLHWRVSDSSGEWDSDSECNKIVYFDPRRDKFRKLPTPKPRQGEENAIVGLGIIDDCLCMARKLKETEEIEVLLMKEYKIKKSWTSKFVISTSLLGGDFRTISIYSSKQNSKVLIWTYGFGWWRISVFHLKHNKLRNFLEESVHKGGPIGICSYVESLASPHEFILRDNTMLPYAVV